MKEIEVKDLRIGNWLYNFIGEYFQVNATTISSFHSEFGIPTPISLTKEVLLKCGFLWVDGYLSISLNSARMRLAFRGGECDKMSLFQYQGASYDSAVEREFCFGDNHPIYLHQLQNLYHSLSGDELNVNLLEEEQKYIFIVDKGIKEIWYDGDLVKRWKGNPLASDIALFIYEQGWHTNINVSDEVWHEYLTKEIGRLIDLK